MRKITKLNALANLVRLGVNDPRVATHYLKKWLLYQNRLQSLLNIKSPIDLPINSTQIFDKKNLESQFFITTHYGMYPSIILYLSNLHRKKKITCLVGKQKALSRLKQLLDVYKLNVNFLEIGHSPLFFRQCIKNRDSIFLSFTDIPLGISQKRDESIDFIDGTLRIKNGLLKISEKLKLIPRFLVSDYSLHDKQTYISSYSADSIESIFNKFERHIIEKPYLWDKITDIHNFYETRKAAGAYISFKIKGSYFILDIDKNKALQVNKPLYFSTNLIKLAEKTKNPKTSYDLRSKIYEETALQIQKIY